MLSNTERGKAFQILCRDALKRAVGRDFDLEVPFEIGGGKRHLFDLATTERDIVAECKAFKFTVSGNNPSAKIITLREAAMYLRSIKGNVTRILILKHDPHPKRMETLGRYFVRLNLTFLEQVTVLEMPESGGDLVCIHGSFDAKSVEDYLEHIAEAIDRATGYLESVPDLAAFRKYRQVQDAVVRNIDIIGKAVDKINTTAPGFIQQHPELPWAQMRAMRDVVMREYFFVDLEIVWTTVKNDLPRLKQQIDALRKR